MYNPIDTDNSVVGQRKGGWGLVEEGKGEENGDIYNSANNKNKKFFKEFKNSK